MAQPVQHFSARHVGDQLGRSRRSPSPPRGSWRQLPRAMTASQVRGPCHAASSAEAGRAGLARAAGPPAHGVGHQGQVWEGGAAALALQGQMESSLADHGGALSSELAPEAVSGRARGRVLGVLRPGAAAARPSAARQHGQIYNTGFLDNVKVTILSSARLAGMDVIYLSMYLYISSCGRCGLSKLMQSNSGP